MSAPANLADARDAIAAIIDDVSIPEIDTSTPASYARSVAHILASIMQSETPPTVRTLPLSILATVNIISTRTYPLQVVSLVDAMIAATLSSLYEAHDVRCNTADRMMQAGQMAYDLMAGIREQPIQLHMPVT